MSRFILTFLLLLSVSWVWAQSEELTDEEHASYRALADSIESSLIY